MALTYSLEQLLNRCWIGNVAIQPLNTPSASLQLRDRLLQPRLISAGNNHAITRARKGFRHRQADAPTSSRDESYLHTNVSIYSKISRTLYQIRQKELDRREHKKRKHSLLPPFLCVSKILGLKRVPVLAVPDQ